MGQKENIMSRLVLDFVILKVTADSLSSFQALVSYTKYLTIYKQVSKQCRTKIWEKNFLVRVKHCLF